MNEITHRKTKAHERHKIAVQEAFNFAVTMCYAVPQLTTHLDAVEQNVASLQIPTYYAGQNSPAFLRANIAVFEQRVSTYLLLSVFSFFEAFVKDIVAELFTFHGGADAFIALAEKRDRAIANEAESPDIAVAKGKLRKHVKEKSAKYQKYSRILRATHFRFPTERLSSFGARMLVQQHKRLKAAGIPDFMEHGLSIPITAAE